MTSGYMIKITYADGKTDERYADDYEVKNGCLAYYVRNGMERGTHVIPLERIAEFKVDR